MSLRGATGDETISSRLPHPFGARDDKSPLRVAVLMGGISSEREISLRSGRAIAQALAAHDHRVTSVDVQGLHLADFLDPAPVDVAFIALHGQFGEDGQVQKQCEAMGLIYTGSGPAASALALDKIRSKEVFFGRDLNTPRYQVVRAVQAQELAKLRPLGLPVVVKPALEGSSIGLTIVRELGQMEGAIAKALEYGKEVLVEEFICGPEITVGILAGEALPVIQIVPSSGVYDYHSKYTPGETQYLVPASLNTDVCRRAQREALQAFSSLGCEDFGRVDFIVSSEGVPYCLEVNTIPGFTATSLLPKAAQARGIDFAALCEKILMLAMQKTMVR